MVTKESTCKVRQLTATGIATYPGEELVALHLCAGSGAAATAILDYSQDGSGDDYIKLAAATSTSDHLTGPIEVVTTTGSKPGAYATLAGAGAVLTVLYR